MRRSTDSSQLPISQHHRLTAPPPQAQLSLESRARIQAHTSLDKTLVRLLANDASGVLRADLLQGLPTLPAWMQSLLREILNEVNNDAVASGKVNAMPTTPCVRHAARQKTARAPRCDQGCLPALHRFDAADSPEREHGCGVCLGWAALESVGCYLGS